jgi:ATP-dependent protease HslVU (ClpYQ), ATPase subunit
LLEDEEVTIKVEESKKVGPMDDQMGQMGLDMSGMMDSLMPKKTITRTLPVKEARELLIQQESQNVLIMMKFIKKLLKELKTTELSLLMSLIKLLPEIKRLQVKSLVKVFNVTFCLSLKAHELIPSMVQLTLTTFSLLLVVPLLKASQVI